jgi:hypothetical protein
MALIATISELIIPTDDHSPGAIAAEVPAFADLMVSEFPRPRSGKELWTDGLAAIDNLSRGRHNVLFNEGNAGPAGCRF